MLVFEVNEAWLDGVDLDGDNASDASKRNLLKQFNPQEKANAERLFAYATINLNHADGTIRYGTFDLNLFKPPVNLRKRLQKNQLKDQQIKVTIQMPENQAEDDREEEYEHRAQQERVQEALIEKGIVREIPYVECSATYVDHGKQYRHG